MRESSREKIYQELGLESLKLRRWYRKLCFFCKILKDESPSYLFDIIPKFNRQRETRNSSNLPLVNVKHEFFRNTFFPSVIID